MHFCRAFSCMGKRAFGRALVSMRGSVRFFYCPKTPFPAPLRWEFSRERGKLLFPRKELFPAPRPSPLSRKADCRGGIFCNNFSKNPAARTQDVQLPVISYGCDVRNRILTVVRRRKKRGGAKNVADMRLRGSRMNLLF